MSDFPSGKIEIRYSTDNWGPFNFDLSNALPSGDTIADVDVKAYLDNIKPTADLSEETEITSSLIDTNVAPTHDGDSTVSLYLKYPGDTYKGQKATLVITVTLTNQTGVHPFFFNYVSIQ